MFTTSVAVGCDVFFWASNGHASAKERDYTINMLDATMDAMRRSLPPKENFKVPSYLNLNGSLCDCIVHADASRALNIDLKY